MGAGGHATSVANVAISAGYKIRYFIDPGVNETEIFGVSIKKRLAGLAGIEKCNFAIGIGDNSKRESVFLEVEQELGAVNFPCLVHEFAIISQFATLGEGSVIMPGAVVGPRTSIGRFCIVNTNASIDHDSIMLDYSSLAPGAVTGGKVEIGKRSAVCLGARVRDKLTIGADSVLGANSYLNKNLPDSQLAYGTPARLIRARSRNDGYL